MTERTVVDPSDAVGALKEVIAVIASAPQRAHNHQLDFDRDLAASKKLAAHLRSVGLATNEHGEQVKGDASRTFAVVRKANPVRLANRARRRRKGW